MLLVDTEDFSLSAVVAKATSASAIGYWPTADGEVGLLEMT